MRLLLRSFLRERSSGIRGAARKGHEKGSKANREANDANERQEVRSSSQHGLNQQDYYAYPDRQAAVVGELVQRQCVSKRRLQA